MHLQGKTALVTGASRGIGRAIALELARQGVQRLLLVARDSQRLAEVVTEIGALGVDAIALPLDLTQAIATHTAISRAWRDYGPIHLLVNAAGVAHQSSFLRTRLPHVQEEIAVNLVGLYTITRSLARRMAARREGHIVNVSSLMGKVAAPTMATYSATKFAILGFTQALRGELAPYNVQVSALLPSLTDTDMVRELHWFRWVVPLSPSQVAKALVHGLKHDRAEIPVGWQSHLAIWANRLAPWLVEQVVHRAAPSSLG
ncbi:SDR family NAD(P)-dependent oxidoreductase [Trichothermofontia sichuanensis B231]|uniref:SDR family NAD(P)-dependent oxidoreductase n=1 Tax=Trichothermofontia sichuanensis TaxID=3045816 RepID=UPI002246373B|nr:SDR family NAD(P)-dependent oxidoreductase [Trichothermofontia sichuanensis]UZQ53453.1 SDR family NAD(P)-dependent oxidoreductase [Trichothermofontia sichuanensis B231]